MIAVHIKSGYFCFAVAENGAERKPQVGFRIFRFPPKTSPTKHTESAKESSGYTGHDIEIFITAYEITASIVEQTKANRAHH